MNNCYRIMTGLFGVLSLIGLAAPPSQASELLVFAASSLREPFTEIGHAYQDKTGQKVIFNFSGSQVLRAQIEFGAPADLFAAANPEIIQSLIDKKLINPPHYFAGNRLVVLVGQNAKKIDSLKKLRQPGLLIAIGNNSAPIGQYTRALLANMADDPQFGPEFVADIKRNVRTEESSVKSIVAKVVLGEVDAGIAYQSDLTDNVRKKLTSLKLPQQHNPLVRYPAAIVSSTEQAEEGRTFLNFLLSPTSQRILSQHSFLPAAQKRIK